MSVVVFKLYLVEFATSVKSFDRFLNDKNDCFYTIDSLFILIKRWFDNLNKQMHY